MKLIRQTRQISILWKICDVGGVQPSPITKVSHLTYSKITCSNQSEFIAINHHLLINDHHHNKHFLLQELVPGGRELPNQDQIYFQESCETF